uniref:Uncharacterized protein n=1 Tax=Rhizophora mucronata TaxID=61149 RepID=A0A2P2PFM5_RHIMU
MKGTEQAFQRLCTIFITAV